MGDIFSFASKIGVGSIFRIGLSGIVSTLLIFPVQNALIPDMLKIDELGDFLTILLPEAIILGLFLSLFQNVIYRIYEGRLLWPTWLHNALTKRMDRMVIKRFAMTKNITKQSARYRELWYWLRVFPLNEKGDPCATRPTMLGNILEGYETYPDRRYGMDSIFYWYRLWPTLPESFINHADLAASGADMLMFSSASALLSSIGFGLLGGVGILSANIPALGLGSFVATLPGMGTLFPLSILYLFLFYLFYRFSIPLHRSNGEFYKAAFDLYRNNIKGITEITEYEKQSWVRTWCYLQYLYVQCKSCKEYFFAEDTTCPHCGKPKRWP